MIQIHIYANSGVGDGINYSTPIGTATGTTFAAPPVPAPSDTTYAIRFYDTATGLEERNVSATCRLVVDAAGADVTRRPAAPTGLSAIPTASGGARVAWQYAPNGWSGTPTGFHVYRGTPASGLYVPAGYLPPLYVPSGYFPSGGGGGVDYATPVATVPYARGRLAFTASLAGLADGVTYLVSARSFNATAEEDNTITVTVTGDATGPDPVEGLTAVATS